MEFSLCCQCGETLIVRAVDAGRTRDCPCLRSYQVPPLMELRTLEAAGAVNLPAVRTVPQFYSPEFANYSEAEKLRALDRRAKLPLEQRCLFCDVSTNDKLSIEIDCERAKVRPSNSPWMYVVIAILFPIDALTRYITDRNDKEVIGEDVVVRTPLRVCTSCAPPLHARPAAVREKLLEMQLYQPLLREYPEAAIRIVDK
jgi:hypothetical protein